MSKMDGLRAMREARYAEDQKRTGAAAKKPAARPPVAPTSPASSAATRNSAPAALAGVEAVPEELCGHRNISGRSCTRDRGHAAKSHRYS